MRRSPTLTLLCLLVLPLALPAAALASDHRDAPEIDEDAAADLTDLFVFRSPADPARTVLALAVNPFFIPGVRPFFSPSALYQFHIDQDGDGEEELVIQARFRGTAAAQTVELYGPAKARRSGKGGTRPLGGSPAASGATNEVVSGARLRLFAGLRDDPFFFDQQAFFVHQSFRAPGVDFYAGKNVSALVVELPTRSLLGRGTALKVWASSSRKTADGWEQRDRLGLPAVNVVLVPAASRDRYNHEAPKGDRKDFGGGLDQTLSALGIGDAATRTALGQALLPDALPYDSARPTGFLNGRRLEDDVIDAVLGLLAGKGAAVPTDPAGKPTDHVDRNDVPFLPAFPYLAPPHEAP